MFCVLFEVEMRPDKGDHYFAIAGALKPELQKSPGFIHNERFESPGAGHGYVSYSTWVSERALVQWRNHTKHHHSQAKGRTDIFSNYRIRIGAMLSSTEASGQPLRSMENFELTGMTAITSVVMCEHVLGRSPLDAVGSEQNPLEARRFRSLIRENVGAELTGWSSASAAQAYMQLIQALDGGAVLRARHYCVIRDYSLLGRDEAPQYYPKVRPEGTRVAPALAERHPAA